MFLSLPTSLLALLFASPVLAAPSTPNDLFHAIAVYAPKPPEEPVCCLRPLPPLEPPQDDDLLLSFEDWKAKRFSEAAEREHSQPTAHRVTENASHAVVPDAASPASEVHGTFVASDAQETGVGQERMAPHFRIPIHDRFNYASLDCSARVHSAHKSAKNPSAILSHKKDRYMLSPCAEKQQFVIVELCEDIRIDTVQLANYEFFSGVFKDFTVSVSKTYYPNDPDSWTFAGTYRAKNVRGVQSFHTPPTLRDFYRYIRIDFHSHYGNEYYCPLSLLRVYGLTHLEEWQWETWEAESRAKRTIEEASPLVEVVAEPPQPMHAPVAESLATKEKQYTPSVTSGDVLPDSVSDHDPAAVSPETADPAVQTPSPSSNSPLSVSEMAETPVIEAQESQPETLSQSIETHSSTAFDDHSRSSADPLYHNKTTSAQSSSVPVSSSSSSASSPSSSTSTPSIHPRIVSTASDNLSSSSIYHHTDSGSGSHSSASASSHSAPASSPNVSSLSVVSPSYSHSVPSAPPASTGGESIYRLIMNRLTALEANTTLYARYVEEQTAGMREVLRRLTEDIGRLESISKAQAQLYHRSVAELEKHTRRLETEHQHLVSRVNHLTDEVVLEKRLGIAQLCLLLTVLVFMALTRGSRGEVVHPARGTVRDWGRRTLSFSGDWVNRLRTRSSTPPRPAGQKPGENEVAFPTVDTQLAERFSQNSRRAPVASSSRRQATRPHTPTSLRTPSSRHFAHHRAVPSSPSFHLPRPAIQRSSSGSMTLGFGGVGPVPRSAKRWARSAHLHEVKGVTAPSPNPEGGSSRQRGPGKDLGLTPQASRDANDGAEPQDVFGTPSRAAVLLDAAFDGTRTLSKGKARASGIPLRHPSPLRPAPAVDISSPPPPSRGRDSRQASGPIQREGEAELSEGDAWVDTDVDGSECDMGVDAGVVSGATGELQVARERTYVAGAAANSSL
ncbi:hypothetical protein FKP32DRAFT_1646714 [Trametes sanguinea]|nr:hypothetical protein FKP32DRAFT_1646714 [Trametes sanguinea]